MPRWSFRCLCGSWETQEVDLGPSQLPSPVPLSAGIRLGNAHGVRFSNIRITNFPGGAGLVVDSGDIETENVVIDNCLQGLVIGSTGHVRSQNGRFDMNRTNVVNAGTFEDEGNEFN